MRKLDLGQTLQLLGNVGVIIGILLLVYELNQNREMTQAQTRNSISETTVTLQLAVATNTDLQEMGVKVFSGEPLSVIETQRFESMWTAFFRFWENVHYQHRQGLFDDSEYFAIRNVWQGILDGNTLIRESFCGRQSNMSPAFFSELSGLLENGCE